MIRFSRWIAIVAGVLLPLGETARRWHELGDPAMWLVWLDDWAIGAFLLYGAWRTRRDIGEGRHVLAAAWGFACGLGYASFVSSVLATQTTDPSGAPMWIASVVKGVMLIAGLVALAAVLRWKSDLAQADAPRSVGTTP